MGRYLGGALRILLIVGILSLGGVQVIAQQRSGSVRGQVTDPLGALVVGASVILTNEEGTEKTIATGNDGIYNFTAVVPGKYSLKVSAPGFNIYESSELTVNPGSRTNHDVHLTVTLEKQVITVNEEANINTDPANNADALVLKGQDIDVLPDDPDALASAVQAMAGPSTGPNGGQIFVDGFTGGR